MVERRLRLVEIVVSATDEELEAITDRVGDVICQPVDHDDACTTPWTLMASNVDDLDEPRRSGLRQLTEDA